MKTVIVGGVAGGASAAARLRRLDEDATIVMFERGQHVSFANCGLPYHVGGVIKERDSLLLQTPQSLNAMLKLDVRVGQEVRRIDRKAKTVSVMDLKTGREQEERYDKLVLAPGASPLVPNLKGIDHPGIRVLRNMDDMDRIKKVVDGGARSAIVIGGGYIGVEMAENLRHRGVEVDVVEMAGQMMVPFDREMARVLEKHMIARGVRLHLRAGAAAFGDDAGRVRVELVDGRTLTAELVILAVGVKPDSELARAAGLALGDRGGIKVNEHMQTSDPDIYAAGDAVEVIDDATGLPMQIPLAGPANRQGRIVADNIAGRHSIYRTTKGTAVVKVFDMTGAVTGAAEKTLQRTGKAYRKLYIHPNGHAGYYPGTAPMQLKVLFAPEDGRILGAQAVGFDGVDKRIDVLATAMQAGMTVRQLQDLELCYAPPFGSAKDPVNMAGFVATNMLDGTVEFWYAEDYPEKTTKGTLLDVRSPQEFEAWHIPGAMNIPLNKLRGGLDALDRTKQVFVYCKVGFRSYLAYRILRQKGFDRVATLSGGSETFRIWHDVDVVPTGAVRPDMPYGEASAAPTGRPAGKRMALDVCGLQCPGPIRRLNETMKTLTVGDDVAVTATDPGFGNDVPAWCRANGHEVLSIRQEGPKTEIVIRKGVGVPAVGQPCSRSGKKTMVVFSGELDKVLASFVIANGAASMGSEVTMFFTFWGLNALRKGGAQAGGKGLLDRMFGWMMPNGASALKLSQMHMMGMGTALMKHVMKSKNVDTLELLMGQAKAAGVKLVACSMSMDVMGLKREELIDGLQVGGVATFLGESQGADMTLFI